MANKIFDEHIFIMILVIYFFCKGGRNTWNINKHNFFFDPLTLKVQCSF